MYIESEADREEPITDLLAATVTARRAHIHVMAKCVHCGWPRGVCDDLVARHEAAHPDDKGPKGDFCTARPGMQGCHHVESEKALAVLLDEVLAGKVRTVAEVDPPPVQGPRLPDYGWLLDQGEWWYPHRRPAVRIAEMDKAHRYNTLQWLLRKADRLHLSVGMRFMHDAPDDVWASFEHESPAAWLRDTPLGRALARKLPTRGAALARLAERAAHWSTCPMRLKVEERPQGAVCSCIPLPAARGGAPTRTAVSA